jgi:hypothetical protein
MAEGKSAVDAHEAAGYRRNSHNAGVLSRRDDIRARVSELLAERQQREAQATQIAVERAGLTKESVIRGLIQNAEKALKAKEGSPVANRALELLGKDLGMFVDRAEISQTSEFSGMSLDEMRVELVARARRLGLDRELAGLLEGPADQDADDPGLN